MESANTEFSSKNAKKIFLREFFLMLPQEVRMLYCAEFRNAA